MQAAMNNMTNELMLLGFATLILLGFQRNIVEICSECLSAAPALTAWLLAHLQCARTHACHLLHPVLLPPECSYSNDAHCELI